MPLRSRPLRLLALLALFGVLAVGAAGTWYLFLRGPAPAAVGLAPTPTPPATQLSGATSAPEPEPSPDGGLDGAWTVDPSIGSFDEFSGTFVGYRVQEELVGIGAATAVGRTPDVVGSLTFEGSTITAAEITADLTTLRSDSSMRDGQLGRQGLETETFPTAVFVLAEPIELGSTPGDGEVIDVTGVGDLTLHGQTKRVEIPLQARLAEGVATVAGTLDIAFADYGIPTPQSGRVLSIDEIGTMEFQLHFTKR